MSSGARSNGDLGFRLGSLRKIYLGVRLELLSLKKRVGY
jgi:hypothetical protein